MCSVFGLIVCV
uniref:Uncharacterized protein n=1 Tax=Anopheles quadriannulatus TaxID=34691 RepID=A0A182XTA7_ANOQN